MLLAFPAFITAVISFTAPDNISNKSIPTIASCQAAPESVKIGYVDPYTIIPSLKQWNDVRAGIQNDLETRTKQIEDLKTLHRTKTNELQSMINAATPQAIEQAKKELSRLAISIQAEEQAFPEHAERTTQEAQMVIFREIELAAKEYALEQGIDFIFAGGAIYVNDKFNISQNIADRMNSKYKAQSKKVVAPQRQSVVAPTKK